MACSAENLAPGDGSPADDSQSVVVRNPLVITATHDISPPLRDIPPVPFADTQKVVGIQRLPRKYNAAATTTDPVVQASIGAPLMPATGVNVDGIGQGFSGPSGAFTVQSAPPDTNGDVGPNHYVQIVNSAFAVFNKSGTPIYGPVNTKTLWSGFAGACSTNNDGDGVVRYDRANNRWVIQQFSVSTTPYLQCVAVSTTADPTGSYARYSFSYGTSFPDYPKMAIWPDGYYVTFNMFANGQTFAGSKVCAYDRAKMVAGLTATMQCFDTTTAWGGLLAADLDSSLQPPAGAPNLIVGLGTNQLAFWKFHVDWTTPANSTFTGPTTIATASFTELCNGGACIVQPGTTQKLDSLSDRLMNRVAYRAFADGHESLLVSHSVTAGTSGGVRWYEIRNPTNPTIYQQGTFAPDSAYRWMPSMAMDQAGNIAIGYSVASGTINPSIRYTGRLTTDALGTLGQGESTIVTGGGSQGTTLERWGDYASMSVDPSDDCTFWFTTEYMATSGTFNWHTRIASFKYPGCGGGTGDTTPPTTSITAPAGGSTVSGTVTVSANASDNVGVTKVEFYAGTSLIGTSTAAPYSVSWNTTTVANGAYSLTSKAYDAAGNVGTSAAVSVSVNNGGTTCGTSSQLLANPGFESGNVSWTASTSVIDNGTTYAAHSGTWKAWLDGYGTTHTDTAYQDITIPAGACTAQLTFWVRVDTAETTTTTAFDKLTVSVRNTSNTVLATLATYSNLNKSTTYAQKTFDLAAYKGQTIRIHFNGAEDTTLQTSFLVDDVAVNVTQ